MKRSLWCTILFLIFFLSFSALKTRASTPPPAPRFASCDLCGYCLGKSVPQNWESCRACLYPDANSTPENNSTLLIAPNPTISSALEPPTPKLGRHYTMIGCINTNIAGGFTEEGAAGNVVQRLLNILFSISGGVAFLYLLYGSFLVLTSQSEPEKLNRGKRTIYGSVVGIIFVILAVFIVNFIGNTLLRIPGFGG